MGKSRFIQFTICIALLDLITGCSPNLQELMAQPPRPQALNRLDAFIGEWSGDAEIKIDGMEESMTGTGSSSYEWDADKWVLVERWQHGDPDDENMMKGIGTYWWDADKNKYRAHWTGNHGGYGHGTMTYDQKTDTWHMKNNWVHHNGTKTVGEGTMKFTNPDTLEWSFKEWGCLKMNKLMEGSGTSHRQ